MQRRDFLRSIARLVLSTSRWAFNYILFETFVAAWSTPLPNAATSLPTPLTVLQPARPIRKAAKIAINENFFISSSNESITNGPELQFLLNSCCCGINIVAYRWNVLTYTFNGRASRDADRKNCGQNQKNPFFHFFSPEKSFFLDVVNVSLSGEETAVTDSKRGFFLKKPRPK